MMGIARGALTDEARLSCNEDQVGLVARSDRLAQWRNQLTRERLSIIDQCRAADGGINGSLGGHRLKQILPKLGDVIQDIMV
jgi:hypothetical protein